jgi:hypothetical protein
MLDKMMTPFWLRQRHYPDDPLAPYHTRFGIKSPRVDDNKRFFRERKKVLMDDLTADRYFDRWKEYIWNKISGNCIKNE